MRPSQTLQQVKDQLNKRFRPERTYADSWNTKRRYRLS